LCQQFVGFGVDDGFLCQLLVLLNQVLGKIPWVGAEAAAIQLHDTGGHMI